MADSHPQIMENSHSKGSQPSWRDSFSNAVMVGGRFFLGVFSEVYGLYQLVTPSFCIETSDTSQFMTVTFPNRSFFLRRCCNHS